MIPNLRIRFLSRRTVDYHRHTVFMKLDILPRRARGLQLDGI